MKKRFTSLYFVFTIVLSIFFGHIQAQSSKSTALQFSSNYEVAVFAAIDTGNRIISVGDFTDSAYIQNTKQGFSGKDSFDAFIICTNEQGNIIWKDVFGAAYCTWATNVICDKSGNYFVTGYFEKGFNLDGIQFDSTNYYNAFLIKLDHNGKVIWGVSYAVPYAYVYNTVVPQALACDAENNLYFDMVLYSSLKIKNQVFSTNHSGQTGCLLIKFDPNGNIIWGKTMEGHYGTFSALAADEIGHLYIGGNISNGKTTWGGVNLPDLSDTVSEGLFFAKLDANTGDMQWIQRCTGTTSYSELTYMNVGINGSVYAAGSFGDTLSIEGNDYYATPHQYNGYQDGLVINFDTSGKLIWLQHYGNYYEPEYPAGFCMDQNDNVYIGGVYDAPITLGNKTLFSTKARDCYVIRFDRYGNYKGSVSTKAISSQSFTGMFGLMTDTRNNLFVTGFFDNQTNFGGDTLSCFGPSSSFIWGVASSFTTGIEPDAKESVNGFRLYPNPVNENSLNIEIENGIIKGNLEVSCMDATGRLIFSGTLNGSNGNSFSLQLPELKQGLYFLQLVSANGTSVQKFIKD